MTLNQALHRLDAIVQISLSSRSLVLPSSDPRNGHRFIPAKNAQGVWGNHEVALAVFQDAAWSFLTPQNGWLNFIEDEGGLLVHDGGNWREIATTAINPLALVGINSVADGVNRLSIRSAAYLLDHEEQSHQLKINKAKQTATASCVLQSAYIGKAEIGLTGSDDLNLNISSDGVEFSTARTIRNDTGFTGLGTDAPASRLQIH